MNPVARLVVPALRWRASSGFRHEQARIDATLKLGVGGYILFGGPAADVRALTSDLQAASAHPLLIASDLERGAGQQFPGLTHLPPAAALGFLGNPTLARRCGEITAREAHSVGVNWIFAPVADLDSEPDNPIVQTRSFGDDPARVASLVSEWAGGAQQYGLAAAVKHYPGHGRATADSHATLPVVPTPVAQLEATDLEPFRAAVASGVRSIMTAHVAYPAWDPTGTPATLSRTILDYPRERWDFNGPIVTDAFIMEGALRGRGPGRAAVAAVAAGCDVLLYPSDAVAVAAALDQAATAPAARTRMDTALGRVATLAESMQAAGGPAPDLVEHRHFANATADIMLHLLRGDSLQLRDPLLITVVDDDVGGPYLVGPRDIFAKTLKEGGVRLGPGGSQVTAIYAEPRSWKGRAALGPRSVAAVSRGADLFVLFGHPRLLAQIPGTAPVVCAWHGQPLMQEAAARWVAGRMR